MSMANCRCCLLGSYLAKQNCTLGGTRPKVTLSTDMASMYFQGALLAFFSISSLSTWGAGEEGMFAGGSGA
jgi:hypothetical protein